MSPDKSGEPGWLCHYSD